MQSLVTKLATLLPATVRSVPGLSTLTDAQIKRRVKSLAREIKAVYGDGEFTVMRPGKHVLCAVTGQKVPIETLRYWSPVLQEAYAGPAEALKRWQEVKG